MDAAASQHMLSGIELDFEILRFVRDSTDRTPATIRATIEAAFPDVPRCELLNSFERLTRAIA
ncbi:hypothetical protein F6X40_17600 [Paraburkholderia sp. UCT31]|uniref:hypothetical protein n=1 Tax=Paraburkholderia sp. UCT31 TaxID=2615209 RepID=UPI001654DBDB|nr:hypothetical protein [Paraburkholderia sp. UCT31]MBC8738576.1 hypothetical protein [Paraburkholderia sp. UCT31]